MEVTNELAEKQGEEGERLKIRMESIGWEIWKGQCEAKFKDEKPNTTIVLEWGLRITKETWERGNNMSNA